MFRGNSGPARAKPAVSPDRASLGEGNFEPSITWRNQRWTLEILQRGRTSLRTENRTHVEYPIHIWTHHPLFSLKERHNLALLKRNKK